MRVEELPASQPVVALRLQQVEREPAQRLRGRNEERAFLRGELGRFEPPGEPRFAVSLERTFRFRDRLDDEALDVDLRVGRQTLHLETVLRTIVSRATQLAGMDAGAIYEYDETREEFYLRTVDQYADDLIAVLRARPIRKGEGALGRLAVVGEPVQVRNIMDESVYQSGSGGFSSAWGIGRC